MAPRIARADTPNDDDTVLPCRPTIACTADLAKPGTLEIEAGGLAKKLAKNARSLSTPLLVKYTFDTWLQLQIGDNGFTKVTGAAPALYFDDVTFGPKLHLVDERGPLPSIALSGEIALPTLQGQKGYVRTYDVAFTGYVTKRFGPLELDLNAGLTELRVDGAPVSQGLGALAFTLTLPSPFGLMWEAYEFTDAAPLAARDGGALAAITLAPKPWMIFDAGMDASLFPSTRSYSAFVGVTFSPYVDRRVDPNLPGKMR